MQIIDIVLGLLLAYGLYKGLKNGFFVEIASLIALVAGLFGAIHFSYIAGGYLEEHLHWNENNINIASFIVTFIVIVIIVHFAAKFLTKIANFVMLGFLNKIAGALFGTIKIAVILGALLVFFERINASVALVNNESLENSILYEPIKEIGSFVFNAVLKSSKM